MYIFIHKIYIKLKNKTKNSFCIRVDMDHPEKKCSISALLVVLASTIVKLTAVENTLVAIKRWQLSTSVYDLVNVFSDFQIEIRYNKQFWSSNFNINKISKW